MDRLTVFPNKDIHASGPISNRFLEMGIDDFIQACRFVHELPYGYNTNRDNMMLLFEEKVGSCTTKHAVIATLALELNLPISKWIGIYAMTEEIVVGADHILAKYALPYLPMLHCFLVCGEYRVDLMEGNHNGKKRSIESFLYTQQVPPDITAKNEYLLYRKALNDSIMQKKELSGISIKRILQAREEGLELLKANLILMVEKHSKGYP
jgi:hypothetical protein